MGVRHQNEPDIAVGFVDGHHIGRRAQRECLAESRDRRRRIHRLHVLAHHLFDSEVAHPADIGGAADGLAAQMEAPGRERIAEHFAGHLRGNDHRDQHRGGQPQVAGGLQRDERHRQRPADHRGRQRAHADHGIGVRIEIDGRPDHRSAPPPADGRRARPSAAKRRTSRREIRSPATRSTPAILSTNRIATVRSDKSSMPATRSAPWPDDMICGDTSAISPTTRPPAMVRSVGRSRRRANNVSHSATPRIRIMPEHRRQQAERRGEHQIVRRDRHLLGSDDAELGRCRARARPDNRSAPPRRPAPGCSANSCR